MARDNPSIFRPFLHEFFIKAADPFFTCTLKLDVLAALVTKDNCATILGELQTYVLHRDKSFVCAAVRAVGRVADAQPEVAEQCLQVSAVRSLVFPGADRWAHESDHAALVWQPNFCLAIHAWSRVASVRKRPRFCEPV